MRIINIIMLLNLDASVYTIQMYFLQLLSSYCFNATLCCMGTLILPHRNLKL